MPKIQAENFLDDALKDVDTIYEDVFKDLDPRDALFDQYQPAIVGTAGLIRFFEDSLADSQKEEDLTSYSKHILAEALHLQESLEAFSTSCPKAKSVCEHGSQQISLFIDANMAFFTGAEEKEKDKAKDENLAQSQTRSKLDQSK